MLEIEVFPIKEPSTAQGIVARRPISTMQLWNIRLIPVANS